jgi:hypothetical protein
LLQESVVTDVDGTFAITQLGEWPHTIRAIRPGGGEAIAENVATGGRVDLVITRTGSIEGFVRRGSKVVDEFRIDAFNERTQRHRHDHYSRAGGRFQLRDLPAGRYRITARSDQDAGQVEVELAEGGTAKAPDIDLGAGATIVGRMVDVLTKQPVPGVDISIAINDGSSKDDRSNRTRTDEAGRFTLRNVPDARVHISGRDPNGGFDCAHVEQAISSRVIVDVGDVLGIRTRVRKGGKVGNLGVTWKHNVVEAIDPDGPAAETALRVGDRVNKVDEVDLGFPELCRWYALIRVPPGTPIRLGLVRGTVVTIVAR